MVLTRKQFEEVKKQIVNHIKKDLEPVEVILYGSYARKKPHKWSDIDFAVVSSVFREKDIIQRLDLIDKSLQKIKKPFPFDIEYFGYTPEEYENASKLTFLSEIKRTGISIL